MSTSATQVTPNMDKTASLNPPPINRRAAGLVRANRPRKLQLQKQPLALVLNSDASYTNVPELYTKTSIEADSGKLIDGVLIQTHFPFERCTISVRSYNDIQTEENVNSYKKLLSRDQIVVRFATKNSKNPWSTSYPNDLTMSEWIRLHDMLPFFYNQLKHGKHFKKQLIPFRSQHVSSSQHMTHQNTVRQYITINRHYQPCGSDEWHYGKANCTLSVDDFKLLRKHADQISLAVTALDRQFQKNYDELMYCSLATAAAWSDTEDTTLEATFSDDDSGLDQENSEIDSENDIEGGEEEVYNEEEAVEVEEDYQSDETIECGDLEIDENARGNGDTAAKIESKSDIKTNVETLKNTDTENATPNPTNGDSIDHTDGVTPNSLKGAKNRSSVRIGDVLKKRGYKGPMYNKTRCDPY